MTVADPHKFFGSLLYNTVFPLLLILLCPVCVIVIIYANLHLDGSFARLADLFIEGKMFSVARSPVVLKHSLFLG